MRAAQKVALVELPFAQHGRGRAHVQRLAAVRGAGERDFLGGELELVAAAIFEKRDGLEGLGRGPQRRAEIRIPGEGEQLAAGVHDGDRAGVEGFDMRAAVDAGEDCHAWSVAWDKALELQAVSSQAARR